VTSVKSRQLVRKRKSNKVEIASPLAPVLLNGLQTKLCDIECHLDLVILSGASCKFV
jgi:hypothetical protein